MECPNAASPRAELPATKIHEELILASSGLTTSALYRPHPALCPSSIFQHARTQPFLDEPYDAPVCHAGARRTLPPSVIRVEEAADVGIKHPVHPQMPARPLKCQRTPPLKCRATGLSAMPAYAGTGGL